MIVPTAFEASVNATTRVRPVSAASRLAEVERAVLRVDLDSADDELVVAGELEPGCDVPVVVEPRHDDLVARPQLPAERPRQAEVEGGHVGAEADLVGSAAEERGRRHVRLGDDQVAATTRLERPAEVRVRLAEVARHRVDHLVRDLGASGPVEERDRPVEGGEPAP